MVSKKKIHYLCEGGIEQSVHWDHPLPSLGKPHVANGNPSDEFFYPTLTLTVDSYKLIFIMS